MYSSTKDHTVILIISGEHWDAVNDPYSIRQNAMALVGGSNI